MGADDVSSTTLIASYLWIRPDFCLSSHVTKKRKDGQCKVVLDD